VTHPTPDALFDFARGGADAGSALLARHLSACAECREEVAAFRATAALLSLDAAGERGPDCLDTSTVAALVEGSIEPTARSAAMSHLAVCRACRADLAATGDTLGAPAVERELEALRPRTTARRVLRLMVPLAAAAALMVVVARPSQDRFGAVHRSPVISRATTPVLAVPVGEVPAVSSLAWSPVSGADIYRVTVFDAGGSVVLEAEATDTAIAIPDSLSFRAGEMYLWKVEARTGWDRWVSSPLIRFHLQAAHP
jgi:hypothetical protein